MPTRRRFVESAWWGTSALSSSFLSTLGWLSRACADDRAPTPDMVRFTPEIEPLVQKIESTPRESAVEMFADELKRGLSYRDALSALFLSGIRNVNPQPPGFDLHCVFVIFSSYQLALSAPTGTRLLPLFFALDDFKKAQASDSKKKVDFRLSAPSSSLPSADKAKREFQTAMDEWDLERADRAITVMARALGEGEIIESLWEYGARDYRNIGHKAIYVANAVRTLDVIGWQHAEPVLRSLVRSLTDFGKDRIVNGYAFEDQCYRANVARADAALANLPADWAGSVPNSAGALACLETLRHGTAADACDSVVHSLSNGSLKAPSIWDAICLDAGEQMLRQPGIFGIHTLTSANALHVGFQRSANPRTKLLLLLQATGWMAQFRRLMASPEGRLRGQPKGDLRITDLVGPPSPLDESGHLESILEAAGSQPAEAARRAAGFGKSYPQSRLFFQRAIPHVFLKAREIHEFKYPASALEEHASVSPMFKPYLLAAFVLYAPGAARPISPLMTRVQEAIKGWS